MKSKLYNLDITDLLKGAVLAVISAIAVAMLQIIEAGDILTIITWVTLKPILISAISTFAAYILKNFLTNSSDNILIKE